MGKSGSRRLEVSRHLGAFFGPFRAIAALVAAAADLLAIGLGDLLLIFRSARSASFLIGFRLLVGRGASAFSLRGFRVRVVACEIAHGAAYLLRVVSNLNIWRRGRELPERRFSFGTLALLPLLPLLALLPLLSLFALLALLPLLSLLALLLARVRRRHRNERRIIALAALTAR